jgi:hypothetical protein
MVVLEVAGYHGLSKGEISFIKDKVAGLLFESAYLWKVCKLHFQ